MEKYKLGLNLKNVGKVRFILMVLIVLLHSYTTNDQVELSLNSGVQEYLSQVIARVAVPIYFYISGYLFFNNLTTLNDWRDKLSRRTKTLLIPYLIWNLTYGLILLILPTSSISYSNIDFDGVLQIISKIFITPAINPLWFIRDLIIFQALSILLLSIKRKFLIILILLFLFLFIYSYNIPYTFLSSEGLLFFSLGAFKILPVNKFINNRKVYIILFMIISILNLINHFYVSNYYFAIHRIFTLILSILFILIFLNEKYTIPKKLFFRVEGYAFYIFVLHFPIIQLLNRIFTLNGLFGYFFTFILSIISSIVIGYIINKINKPLASVLTGNRK